MWAKVKRISRHENRIISIKATEMQSDDEKGKQSPEWWRSIEILRSRQSDRTVPERKCSVKSETANVCRKDGLERRKLLTALLFIILLFQKADNSQWV